MKSFRLMALIRLLRDLSLPWYSFIRFASNRGVQVKPEGFQGEFANDLEKLRLSPDNYSRSVVIYGSGPSLTRYAETLSEESISPFGNTPLRVSLNSSVYAGLPSDIAFFETPIIEDFKVLHDHMFYMRHHLPAFQDRPAKILFTNYSNDSSSKYLSSASLKGCFILPQFTISLPRLRSAWADVSLCFAFKLAFFLARLGIIPGTIFMRSSLIRALLVLNSIGFNNFLLVGFDGGSSYFYDDEKMWPQLSPVKSITDKVYSQSTISYVKNGVLVQKKPHSKLNHSTQDPAISEYTNDQLVCLLRKWLNIKLLHWR